jgi:hypothetical protein
MLNNILNAILFNTFVILFALFITMLFFIGIFLFLRGIQTKMNNIIIAGIGFIVLPIGLIGYFIFNLGGFFQEFFVFIAYVSTVVFTNLTFYKRKDRGIKNYTNWILFITIILGITQIILLALPVFFGVKVYYLRVSLDVVYSFMVFNWLAWAAFQSFKRLKNYNIAPWVEIRYKLLAIFSFIISFNNIPEFFQPIGTTWGDSDNIISLFVFGITAILAVSFSIGFFVAWIMPNWLKKRINKNYIPTEDKEYSEEELMRLIKSEMDEKSSSDK